MIDLEHQHSVFKDHKGNPMAHITWVILLGKTVLMSKIGIIWCNRAWSI